MPYLGNPSIPQQLEPLLPCSRLSCTLTTNPFVSFTLFDGADSHETTEFQQLAFSYNIILHKYLLHLTHLMQLLVVGCFQTYKHWHKIAVHKAIRHLELGYNTYLFCQDPPSFSRKDIYS